MISFAKVTKATYDALTPVQDRLYYIEDTGEQFLNGKPYNGDDGTRDWLCFTAHNDSATIRLDKVGAPWDIALETSTDGINWTAYTWDGTTGATITLANAGDKVYWRGDNDTFTQGSNNRYQYVMTGTIRASGNIMSLLRKDCSLKEFAENNQRFQYLFGDCASLISSPKLPATKLGYHSYNHLFYNCTGLREVPELPATSFLGSCYANMFDGCTGLRTVPPLPYTGNMACCWGMYANCAYITSVEVPEFMYMGNDHLNTAFQGCTRLKYVKVGFHSFDSATTDWLDGVSATGTFICPSDLTISSRSASTVPSGWKITRDDAVQGDWDASDSSDPSYIENKPDLSTKLDAPSVAGTTGQVLTKTATGQEWADAEEYDPLDYLCFTNIGSANSDSNISLSVVGYPTISLEYSLDKKTWHGINSVGIHASIPQGGKAWFRGNNTKTYASNQSRWNFAITGNNVEVSGNAMSILDKTCQSTTIQSYGLYNLFSLCTKVVKASKLYFPATTLAESCYGSVFYGCTNLVEAPELPATTLAKSCYSGMFRDCTKLVNAPKLPAMTLVESCYTRLFQGCTSLVEAPELPATTLASGCYTFMFYGCTSLKHVKVGFTSTGGNSGYWLNDVSANGVFECPSSLDLSTRDMNTVPAGWTIVRTDSPKSITSPTSTSSETTYEVSPNTADVPIVTVSSALTLSATAIDSGSIAYAEVVIDLAQGASVTAGSGLTMVDTLTAGKRNVCVARWQGGSAKLYVVITEDLDASSSI